MCAAEGFKFIACAAVGASVRIFFTVGISKFL
jgi:hypothetical protein